VKTTIITHFWNEEVLLPHWLKHHLELFDHGVLINYRSTDRSVEIIKELAPNWEIHDTVNKDFTPESCDTEVSEYEKQHPGWKIALTLSEFLYIDNLKNFISQFEKDFPTLDAVRTQGMIMVDSCDEQNKALIDTRPLVLQRHHGYIESHYSNPINHHLFCSRSRLLHKKEYEVYTAGRHLLEDYGQMIQINEKYGTPAHAHRVGIHPELYLCWYGKFSPFEAIKKRYINLNKTRVCTRHDTEWNSENDLDKYEAELVGQRKRAIDLRAIPKYREIYEAIAKRYPSI